MVKAFRDNIPSIPVTLRVARVDIGKGVLFKSQRVDFAVYHENGDEIRFDGGYRPYPIHVPLNGDVVRKKFFGDLLTEAELITLLTKFYEHEVGKRTFTLAPYFTDENFRFWYLDVKAHRQLAGLTVDCRQGVVDWTQLYPKGTPHRIEIHKLINQLGRERRVEREARASQRRMRQAYGWRLDHPMGGFI